MIYRLDVTALYNSGKLKFLSTVREIYGMENYLKLKGYHKQASTNKTANM